MKIQFSPSVRIVRMCAAVGLIGFLSTGFANEKATEKSEEARAHDATDRLTKSERESQMPLPGQGYSHSSLLLDKAKDEQAIDRKLEELKQKGKIKE